MKLGCDTAIFHHLDLDGALKHIAWVGYEGASICYQAQWVKHLELNTNQSYIDRVKNIVRKHGLELSAVGCGFGPGFQELEHKDKIKILTKVMDVAVKLCIPIISIRPFGEPDDKESTKQEFNYISELSKQAESRGMILAVKAHIQASIYDTKTLIQMLNEIDSPALGVNLDPIQQYKGGDDVADSVLKLGKRIVHTHFHDSLKALRFLNLPVTKVKAEDEIPGRGDVDCPKILRRLKEVGYNGAIDFQTVTARHYPMWRKVGIAAEARGYLHRCLQELKEESN